MTVHQRSASLLYVLVCRTGLLLCTIWLSPHFLSLSLSFAPLSVMYVCRDFSPYGAFSPLQRSYFQLTTKLSGCYLCSHGELQACGAAGCYCLSRSLTVCLSSGLVCCQVSTLVVELFCGHSLFAVYHCKNKSRPTEAFHSPREDNCDPSVQMHQIKGPHLRVKIV